MTKIEKATLRFSHERENHETLAGTLVTRHLQVTPDPTSHLPFAADISESILALDSHESGRCEVLIPKGLGNLWESDP